MDRGENATISCNNKNVSDTQYRMQDQPSPMSIIISLFTIIWVGSTYIAHVCELLQYYYCCYYYFIIIIIIITIIVTVINIVGFGILVLIISIFLDVVILLLLLLLLLLLISLVLGYWC